MGVLCRQRLAGEAADEGLEAFLGEALHLHHPATEDHRLGVEDVDLGRDRLRGVHEHPLDEVLLDAAGEHLTDGRRGARRLQPLLQGATRGDRLDTPAVAAAAELVLAVHRHVAEFAGDAVSAHEDAAVDRDRVAEPGADVAAGDDADLRQLVVDQVVAQQVVHVPVDHHGDAEAGQQVGHRQVLQRGQVRGRDDRAPVRRHGRGEPPADGPQFASLQRTGEVVGEVVGEPRHGLAGRGLPGGEERRAPGLVRLDQPVVGGHQAQPQVGAADVEAEHDGGVVHVRHRRSHRWRVRSRRSWCPTRWPGRGRGRTGPSCRG